MNLKPRKCKTAGLLLCFLLAACAAAPEQATKTAAPGEPDAPPENVQPADSPPAAPLELSSGTLWVTIFAPEDGSVQAGTTVEVSGAAAEDTVLTINDEILYLENGGEFSVTLGLLQGPNTIEILASDPDGNEVSGVLVVFHEPTQE